MPRIGDTTYTDLPLPGEPDSQGLLASLGEGFRIESSAVRELFLGAPSSGTSTTLLDQSHNIYNYGDPDGYIGSELGVVNLVQNAINTSVATACRTPPAIIIKSNSVNDDGYCVLKKPFAIAQEPAVAPTGMLVKKPPVELPPFQTLDEEIADDVPSTHKVEITTDTVVEFVQGLFDIKRRESRMDATIREMVFNKHLDPYAIGLFEWDRRAARPIFTLMPPQQWYPDFMGGPDVDDMAYCGLNYIVDAEEAKTMFPQISQYIDENATRAVQQPGGSTGNSSVYNQAFQRPIVTIAVTWRRNCRIPMSADEAIEAGEIELREAINAPGPETTEEVQDTQAPEVGEAEQASGGETGNLPLDAGRLGFPGVAPEGSEYVLVETGEVVSSVRGEDGKWQLHPLWPTKTVIQQWMQINDQTVSNEVCAHWDMPIFLDKNVPYAYRPVGQPETERLRTLQRDMNDTHSAMVDHTKLFKGPTTYIYADVDETLDPDHKNGFSKPGKLYVFRPNSPEDDIRRKIIVIDPPQMPAALPAMDMSLQNKIDKVAGNPGVNQGTPPPGVESGAAIAALQAQATNASTLKSIYSEEAIYRMAMLTIHAIVNWMTPKQIMQVYRKYPIEIVTNHILPFARQIKWDVHVEMATGAGQIKALKDAQVRADFQANILDEETTQDELGYDSAEIQDRKRKRMEEAQQMAAQQAIAAPPPQA